MDQDKSFRAAETMMGMSDAAWSRHTNPWSGWSRLSVLPLLALAAWSRVWIDWWALAPIALVLAWTWLNPRLFPPPASTDNWMSRGVIGERIWLARSQDPALAHHRPVVRALTALGVAGAVILLAGLILLDLPLTGTGLAVAMLSKLWLLDRMVWVERDSHGDGAP
ncbi:DUF6653 family protein [Pleomorphomonas sp. NRK KF1]|uniref:DUF6653 family protein n=1 Tax=Pleomorphomonas sp. NRK KF1 TaxID=2943000 RepID=UPI00204422F3|nr:DUF6653 family protein [Pleomorphomonas sp. NRK KF1]MCM5553971.1 hypothetical protein [Pleomorphomonas sp. NRK KF1]